ncbi:MAG: DUF6531 domain-containing protein [Vicinamibacterales bacterium]
MRRVGGVALGVLMVLAGSQAAAESVFSRSGFAAGRDTHTVFPYEHIDPASGNLLLVQTDLVLPGNAGFDLVVQRVYNSKVHPLYDQGGNTTLEERSWVGVGWRLHFGRVINPTSTTSGATQIELGDGSRHPLYTTAAFPEGWISKGFIRYDRTTHTAKFPNGLVYTFGHVANVGGLLGDVRYVTQIADPFGNTQTFSYVSSPAGALQQIQQQLGGGQTRTVTFAIDPSTNALASMTYNNQTYSFTTQATTNPTGHALLLDTQRPGNLTRWSYQYGSGLTGELTKLIAPSEGEVGFTYANATRTVGGASVLTRVVTQRTTQGTYVTGGTWSFAYSQGAQANKTIVTTPCGTLTYTYKGFGTTGPFPAWQVGLLEETTVEQSGVVFERHTMTYQPSAAISPDPIPPDANGNWGDPAVYNALSDTTWIYRGPQAHHGDVSQHELQRLRVAVGGAGL